MNIERFWQLIDMLRKLDPKTFNHLSCRHCIVGHTCRNLINCFQTTDPFKRWLNITFYEFTAIWSPTVASDILGRPIGSPQDAIHLLFKVLGHYLPKEEDWYDKSNLTDKNIPCLSQPVGG